MTTSDIHCSEASSAQKIVITLCSRPYLFWDVDAASIDPVKHQKFVIERTLRYGFPEDIRLLLSFYDNNSIQEAVRTSRNLDRKTANYWAIHFRIPREEVVCFSMQSITPCFH